MLAISSEYNPIIVTISPGINNTAPAKIITKNLLHENLCSACCIRRAPDFRLRSTLAYTAGLIMVFSQHYCCLMFNPLNSQNIHFLESPCLDLETTIINIIHRTIIGDLRFLVPSRIKIGFNVFCSVFMFIKQYYNTMSYANLSGLEWKQMLI